MAAAVRRRRNAAAQASEALATLILSNGPVLFITGAGISSGSGIPTFRDSADSLWSSDTMRFGTLRSFSRDPLRWYNDFWLSNFIPWRTFNIAVPNAAHISLARIASKYPNVRVITQNIDRLHSTAPAIVPSVQLLRAHGNVDVYRCDRVGQEASSAECCSPDVVVDLWDYAPAATAKNCTDQSGIPSLPQKIERVPPCSSCHVGNLRPACLFFDEDYDTGVWSVFEQWLEESEALVFVGSSNAVGLTSHAIEIAERRKIPVYSYNLSTYCFRSWQVNVLHVIGPAEDTLPRLYDLIAKKSQHQFPS